MIKLQNIAKGYGSSAVLENLSLEFPAGQLHVLIGPSGCGKTTILELINGLIEPDSGTVLFKDVALAERDLIALRRRMGYVIQEGGLFPHFSVFDNIALVPRLLRWEEARVRERVGEMLNLVAIPEERARAFPDQLSGGQQQRVGVARALAADPEVVLMDEPFSALDPLSRERLQDAFLKIQRQLRKTVVLVTHDMSEALKMGDRVVVLNRGKIEQLDTPFNIIRRPKSKFVESFIGREGFKQLMGLLTVEEVMTTISGSLSTTEAQIGADEPLQNALERLLNSPVEQLTVVDNGQPVGLLDLNSIKKTLQQSLKNE